VSLAPGARLGPYEILAPLGAGGMGEVYRARDTRLDREVAIKVLPERLAADAKALSRFEREAKAVAALSHPNILAIHDFGEDYGIRFAVTELLDGQTLRERIAREQLPWRKAVEIGTAMTDGLAAAHAKGIVHLDLKPENVFLTSSGLVKILDFGLARADLFPSEDVISTPTASIQTEAGTVLGTVGYMSPEQLSGESVDARSDIFSFGCLLYEMLSGRRAFAGKSAGETLASILRDHPPEISVLGVALPAALERVVARCLEKRRDERFQSARDLAFHLKEVSSGSAGTAVSSGGHGPAIESIAVLPFANVGADPETEYLSDGIAESIIHSLSRLPTLRVMARTTLSRYKGREIDPQAVGEELKVRAVLTGRVFHRGDSLVIKTELVDVRDGSQIWGENYNRKFGDILALEEEISREISEKLRVKVTGADAQRLTRRATESPEAYRLYLKGLFYWNKRTADGLRKGIELFRQALEVDPEYALAYAGIAHSYNQLGFYQYLSPREAFPKARAAATRALELDASLGEARTVLAMAHFWYDWDWSGAEEELHRAIASNPDFVHVHHFYGIYLTALERFREGLVELHRAEELDPLSLPARASLGFCLYFARRHDEAIVELEKVLEMDPSFAVAHCVLSWAYLAKRMWTEAVRAGTRAAELTGRDTFRLASLGACLAASGRTAEAEAILAELAAASPRRYVSALEIAYVHVALGQTDLAFDWLEKAVAERASFLVLLRVEPRADPLRADPRFAELVGRVGL
jgi:serine/threonine protein kinase/Tfp pilus assembly protein PilF